MNLIYIMLTSYINEPRGAEGSAEEPAAHRRVARRRDRAEEHRARRRAARLEVLEHVRAYMMHAFNEQDVDYVGASRYLSACAPPKEWPQI